MTSYISPKVSASSEKPTSRASSNDDDPSLNPIRTLISSPASANESRKFCACAGACDPQPITPISLIPSNAWGNFGKRSRPPLTICSLVSAKFTSRTSKMSEEKELFVIVCFVVLIDFVYYYIV